jgi:hypothetical protein
MDNDEFFDTYRSLPEHLREELPGYTDAHYRDVMACVAAWLYDHMVACQVGGEDQMADCCEALAETVGRESDELALHDDRRTP